MTEKKDDDIIIEQDDTESPLVPFEENLPAKVSSKDVAKYSPKSGDPLSLYIKEISKVDLLTIEEERELTKKLIETGEIEVAKKLVAANLRLVVKIAMEYRSAQQNIMDLIQEGNIGLMKAVSKYNPEKGAKLSYYASWWIKSYILKFILDNFRLVKIGTTNEQKKLFYNLMKEKDRLDNMGIKPDNKTIAENLGVSEKSVALMDKRLSPENTELSIDTPVGNDASGKATIADFIPYDAPSVEDEVSDRQGVEILKENLDTFIDALKDRDKEIFKKRLLSEVPPSLQSIADDYGVSRERIRQIEARLLDHLKVYMSEFIR
jgi:RNA polymerase sigma-32 factor